MKIHEVYQELPSHVSLGGYVLEAVIRLDKHAHLSVIQDEVNELMQRDVKVQKINFREKLFGIGSTQYLMKGIKSQLRFFKSLGLMDCRHGRGWHITSHMREIMVKDYATEFKAKFDGSNEFAEILKNCSRKTSSED